MDVSSHLKYSSQGLGGILLHMNTHIHSTCMRPSIYESTHSFIHVHLPCCLPAGQPAPVHTFVLECLRALPVCIGSTMQVLVIFIRPSCVSK